MKTIVLNPMTMDEGRGTLTEKFQAVGQNPGNLIFLHSMKEQLNVASTIFLQQEQVDENAVVVMPSSNFIRHVKDITFYENFIAFLQRTKCSVTLCGLGAQASIAYNTPKKLVKQGLHPIQIQFFKCVADRAVTLGVRGEFTAECLEEMGIYNYRIIGCPSHFKYLDGRYPHIKEASLDNVQMTVTPGNLKIGNPILKSKVLEMGMKNHCFWMVQSIGEYPELIKFKGKEIVSPKWMVRKFPASFFHAKAVYQYSKKYSRVFFDTSEWNEFYKQQNITFSFGTRFHGNMVALRNGVPALWVTHDSRTKELVEFLHLPHIHPSEFMRIKHLQELLQFCDYTDTEKTYASLCQNYVDYLEENGLEHKFVL